MINWRWPAKDSNNLVPWYTILRRSLFLPFVFGGKLILCFGIFGARGAEEARRSWDNDGW